MAVPFLLIFLSAAIGAIAFAVLDILSLRRLQTGDVRVCPRCQYDQTGLRIGANCPECGSLPNESRPTSKAVLIDICIVALMFPFPLLLLVPDFVLVRIGGVFALLSSGPAIIRVLAVPAVIVFFHCMATGWLLRQVSKTPAHSKWRVTRTIILTGASTVVTWLMCAGLEVLIVSVDV